MTNNPNIHIPSSSMQWMDPQRHYQVDYPIDQQAWRNYSKMVLVFSLFGGVDLSWSRWCFCLLQPTSGFYSGSGLVLLYLRHPETCKHYFNICLHKFSCPMAQTHSILCGFGPNTNIIFSGIISYYFGRSGNWSQYLRAGDRSSL